LLHQQNITDLCIIKIRRVTCFDNTAPLKACGARRAINTACNPERSANLSNILSPLATDFAHYRSCSTSLSNPLQIQRSFSIRAMLSEVSVSGTSTSQREAQQGAPSKSPAPVVLLRTREKEPPPYGAQRRQDALCEGKEPSCDTHQLNQMEVGGNEALPPLWQQYEALDGIQYQDDRLTMSSWNRPLPGVRLGEQRKCY
jgi:hypothetical protein